MAGLLTVNRVVHMPEPDAHPPEPPTQKRRENLGAVSSTIRLSCEVVCS